MNDIKNTKRRTYKTFDENEKNDIKNMYLNNISTVKIGIKYNVDHKVIARVLDSMNIPRTGKSVRRYKLDENYFNTIDTPNKAYILGLLYADGCNIPSKSTIAISLQEEDKDILEKIRKELKSDKPLEFIDYSEKHSYGYSYKNQYCFKCYSKHMCNTLSTLGMMPRKSLVLQFPNIDQSLYSHFIRGYFDGDGSFCYRKSKYGYRAILTITSTEAFCNRVRNILIEKLNIPGGNIYDASCHNDITKVLSISGGAQTKKVLDWLYQDADLYLERKYQNYITTFSNNI